MVVVSLGNENEEKIVEILKEVECVELRLDKLNLSRDSFISIIKRFKNMIVTYRRGEVEDIQRLFYYNVAIDNDVDYIDIDFYDPLLNRVELSNHTKLIVSYHNYQKTPSKKELNNIITLIKIRFPSAYIKIATMINDRKDQFLLLDLLKENENITVIGMGDKGRPLRVFTHFLGSYFTYTYFKTPTAPGQISYNDMKKCYELVTK